MDRRNFNILLCQSAGALIVSAGAGLHASAQAKKPSRAKKAQGKPAKPPPSEKAEKAEKNDWTEYRSPQGDFVIQFPAQPETKPSNANGASPAYVAVFAGHIFLVQTHLNHPLNVRWTNDAIKQLIREVNAEVEAYEVVLPNVLDFKARSPIEGAPNQYKQSLSRIILMPGLQYTLIVLTDGAGQVDVALASKFLASFKFITAEAANGGAGSQNTPGQQQTVCHTCRGNGRVSCSSCRGTGQTDPALRKVEGYSCRRCFGRGMVTCSTCQGRGRIG